MKYCVTFTRYGVAYVDADTKEAALEIANNMTDDSEINWDNGDWDAVDAVAMNG